MLLSVLLFFSFTLIFYSAFSNGISDEIVTQNHQDASHTLIDQLQSTRILKKEKTKTSKTSSKSSKSKSSSGESKDSSKTVSSSHSDVIRPNSTLALCIITRDDNLDFVEWLDYHQSIGVTAVIIFDNNSSRPLVDTIQPYIQSGFVYHYSYFVKVNHRNKQQYAYQFCIDNFGKLFTYMGFIDSDEFIEIADPKATIINVMDRYSKYGGLTLQWRFFGSSGHVARPDGGVLKNYYKCMDTDRVRTIVHTERVKSASFTPHILSYKSPYFAVDTDFNRSRGPQHAPPYSQLYNVMWVNHYIVKSKEDFMIKNLRGGAIGHHRSFKFFEDLDRDATKNCSILQPRKIEV